MPSSKFNPEEHYEEETLTIVDENERSLNCYIEQSLEIDNMTYLLLVPVDIPVVVMSINSDQEDELEAEMLDDDQAIAAILDNAKAVLAEQNLLLQHTGYTLTAVGELPPIEEDQILTMDASEVDDEIEEEELQFLAYFYHAERKYGIYTPLTPLLFFARYDAQNCLELVSPDRDDLIPILEELLSED